MSEYDVTAIQARTMRSDGGPGFIPEMSSVEREVFIPYGALGSDVTEDCHGTGTAGEPSLAFTLYIVGDQYYTDHSYLDAEGNFTEPVLIPIYGAEKLIARYLEGLDLGVPVPVAEGWL